MKKRKPKKQKKSSFPLKTVIFIGLFLLIIVSVALFKEIIRKYQINREITKVQEEINTLERKNSELNALIEYLNTDSYKEMQARKNLGLKQDGENTIAIESSNLEETETTNTNEITTSIANDVPRSNPGKWWNYFFTSKQ